MKWSSTLWIALLSSVLIFGCSDSGDDSGDGGSGGSGGTGGTAGMDGTGGSGGTAGTGGTGGVGGIDGDFGVVNVDIVPSANPADGEEVYVGDDGVLSTSGGTFWNPADTFGPVTNADDEFGAPTPIDFVVTSNAGIIFIGAATNELQNDGFVNLIEDDSIGFDFRDLSPDGVYDLAIYIYGEVSLDAFTTLDVTSASGITSAGPSEEPIWSLPGEEGKDYFLFEGLSPYEITPGVYGLTVNNINAEGAILAAQLARVD